MDIRITFPGGEKVNAEMNGFVVPTDQPVADGGEGGAPSPYDYFLASLGTCAGYYVLSFCRQRGIAVEGMALSQRAEFAIGDDGKRRLARVALEIGLPPGFPEKYRNAVVKAAEVCAVKKAVMNPPEFAITLCPAA
jgi:ribosomal protein S12 methylthiotransferase accessory factor